MGKHYKMIALSVGGIGKIYESGDIVAGSNFPEQNIAPLVSQGFMRELTEEEQVDFDKKEEAKAIDSNLDKTTDIKKEDDEEQADFDKKEEAETIESVRKKLQSKGIRYGKDESKESLIEKLKAVSE